MTTLLSLGCRLARAGGRTRLLSVAGGNATGCALLLLALAVAGSIHPAGAVLSDDQRRLASTVVVFLCLPIAVLLMSVGRLSSSTRDRRLTSLRLLGLTPARTRIVAAVENGVVAAAGAALGGVVFPVAAPVVGAFLRAGPGWLAQPLHLSALSVLGGCAAVVALSVLVSLAPTRTLHTSPIPTRPRGGVPRPRLWRLVPVMTGAALLLLAWRNGSDTAPLTPNQHINAVLAGTALTGVGLPIALPVAVRAAADLLLRWTTPLPVQLAARRLQAEPASAVRLISGLGVAVFLVTGSASVLSVFEDTPQYRYAQRIVTTGPQVAQVTRLDGRTPTPAQLAAVAHAGQVLAVVRQDDWTARGCNDGTSEHFCGSAFTGTCAQLRLFWDVHGCRDDTAAWITPNYYGDTAATVKLFDGHHHSVTISLGPTHLDGNRAVNRVEHPFGSQYQLFVPATLAQLRPLTGQPLNYLIVSRGGYLARAALQTTAAAQHLDLTLDDISELNSVAGYRLLMWTMAAVVLAIGLLAVLITGIDRAIERRRPLATQVAVGVPVRVLRGGQLGQTLLPLWLGLSSSIVLGALAGAAYTSYAAQAGLTTTSGTGQTVPVMTAAALLGSLVIAVATLPGIGARLTPDLLRRE